MGYDKEEIYCTANNLAICYVYEELADWLNTVFSRAQAGVFMADTWQHAHKFYEKQTKTPIKPRFIWFRAVLHVVVLFL